MKLDREQHRIEIGGVSMYIRVFGNRGSLVEDEMEGDGG